MFALTANPDDPTSLGTYTCEAVNCMGRTYSSSKVHVVGKGSREGSLKPADSINHYGTPPIFTDELKNLKIKLGDAITLGCQGDYYVFKTDQRSHTFYSIRCSCLFIYFSRSK